MAQPKIDYYDFGVMVIEGKTYHHDLIVTPTKIVSDWWRLEGHRLQLPDIRDYLLEDVDVVVIGTGYNGLMRVDQEVINVFKSRGIEVHVDITRVAVEKYNRFVEEGKKVLAFFHLTC